MSRRLAVLVCGVFSTALLSGAGPSTVAAARGAQGQPDPKALMERNKRCLREASAQVSKVSFDRQDLEKVLAEYRSFDALDIDEEDDAADEDVTAMECFDLSTALADRRYVAWARERGLDPKVWLLKSARVVLTHARWRAPAEQAEMKRQMDSQRRELEKRCGSMGPEACREVQKAFASGDASMRELEAMWALFPEPSRAEAALLAQYDRRIRQVLEDEGDRRGQGGLDGPPGDDAPSGEDGPPDEAEE